LVESERGRVGDILSQAKAALADARAIMDDEAR
jgi:hypothetical protein